jgi:pyruvate/2-oxoacid:ferredoxin oxidoreductase alpha subunit
LVLVALLAVQNQRPAQTAATRQSLQSLLQVEVVVVVRRLAQMGKQAAQVEVKAAAYPVLALVQQIKDMEAELLVLAAQIPTLAAAVALEQ